MFLIKDMKKRLDPASKIRLTSPGKNQVGRLLPSPRTW